MRYVKENVLKMMVVVALLSPAVYADGDMGSGGKTCPEGQTCLVSGDTTNTITKDTSSFGGDMGSGGFSAQTGEGGYIDWLIRSANYYFGW